MNIRKLFKKLKIHILSLVVASVFLCLFTYHIKNKLQASNIDYNIRDYAARTLNKMNYGLWSKMIPTEEALFVRKSGPADYILKGDQKTLEDNLFQKGFDSLSINLHERIEVSSTNSSFTLSNGSFDIDKSNIVFPSQTVEVRSMKSDDYFEVKKCDIKGEISLIWNVVQKRYQENLFLESDNCFEFDISIKGNLLSESLKRSQVIMHSIFSLTILGLLVTIIFLLERQLKADTTSNYQVSMSTLLILGTLQLVLGFEQVVFALFNFPCFILIILVAILYFNLFFFLLFKTIASAIRYQMMFHIQNNRNFNLRAFLLFVYFKAHIIILSTFFISLKLIDSPVLYLLWAFALIPQIIKNSFSKTRFLSSQQYISLYYLLTMIYALYMHFFKFSFFDVNSQGSSFTSTNALRILLFALSQIFILILQETLHPCFFLPNKLRPNSSYDYFFGLKELRNGKWKQKHKEQCIICFNQLDNENKNHEHAEGNLSCNASLDVPLETDIEMGVNEDIVTEDTIPLPDEENLNDCVVDWKGVVKNNALQEFLEGQDEENKFMGTPCNHVFHTSCLLVWMSQKMDCPVCRAKLPSII
jgi:uncharacterized membrane protein